MGPCASGVGILGAAGAALALSQRTPRRRKGPGVAPEADTTTEPLLGVVGVLVLALAFFVEFFYRAVVIFSDSALFPL